MEAKNKKHRVFRKNYDLLKDGFACTEVSALLYSKELIGQDVRDSKDPGKILGAVEKVMNIRDEAWDILITEVMVEPPLDSLAAILVKEFEEMPDIPSAPTALGPPSTKRFVDHSLYSDSPVHPISLTFNNNNSSEWLQIDSGTWSSDKTYFPFDYFQNGSLVPSVPVIMESPDSPAIGLCLELDKPPNDSGIQLNHEDDDKDEDRQPSSEPVSSFVPELAQSNTESSRSEMVNPHKGTTNGANNKGKKKKNIPQQLSNLSLEKLKNENTSLKETLQDMQTENDELRSELDSIHTKRNQDLKILEIKLQQLADDNRLLSQQIEEKRHLEEENRQLVYSYKKTKRDGDRCNREIKQLKSCLELAERNARIQSVNIDKLRDKIASQNTIINEHKKTTRYHQWLPNDVTSYECCFTENERSKSSGSPISTSSSTPPAYY